MKYDMVADSRFEEDPIASEATLILITPDMLIGRVMGQLLGAHQGWTVEVMTSRVELRLRPMEMSRRSLILVDARADSRAGLIRWLWNWTRSSEVPVALFNAPVDDQVVGDLVEVGLRGLFCSSDSPDLYLRGIEAMLEGRLWFSRDALERSLLDNRKAQVSPSRDTAQQVRLTQREYQIVMLLRDGFSNKVIADQLHLSLHTIKSHCYHIYRKIGVKNRVDAVLWAVSHLD